MGHTGPSTDRCIKKKKKVLTHYSTINVYCMVTFSSTCFFFFSAQSDSSWRPPTDNKTSEGKMNSSYHNTLSEAAITANIVLSLPTNSYIIWLIVTAADDTVVREFFPLNLAVFEILFSLLSISNLFRHLLPNIHLSCLLNGFLWGGRPMLQCCICMEQFVAVAHPVFFLKYKMLRYKAAFSRLIWVLIVGFWLFYVFSPRNKHAVFASECVILMSVMLFCYFSVLVVLMRPRPGQGKTERDSNMKTRAAFTIMIIIMSFGGTYILWFIAIVSNQRTWFSEKRKIFTQVCMLLTFISGFVQPLMYLQKRGKCFCRKPG